MPAYEIKNNMLVGMSAVWCVLFAWYGFSTMPTCYFNKNGDK